MEIRNLGIEDIPAAAELVQGVFAVDLRQGIMDQELVRSFVQYADAANLSAMMQEKKLFMWGIFEDMHLCGVSAMQPEGHITMLYVYPFYRRRGYGKKLLWEMRRCAKADLHLDRVTVSALPAWTTNYFIRNGFTAMAYRPHPEYVNLEVKSVKELAYPRRRVGAKPLAAAILITIVLILGVAVGYLSYYAYCM